MKARLFVVCLFLALSCEGLFVAPAQQQQQQQQHELSILSNILSLVSLDSQPATPPSNLLISLTNRTDESIKYYLADGSCLKLSQAASVKVLCDVTSKEITTRMFPSDTACSGTDFTQTTQDSPAVLTSVGTIASGFKLACSSRTFSPDANFYSMAIYQDPFCDVASLGLQGNFLVDSCYADTAVQCGNGTFARQDYSGTGNCSGSIAQQMRVPIETCQSLFSGYGVVYTCVIPKVEVVPGTPSWLFPTVLAILAVVVLIAASTYSSKSSGNNTDKKERHKNKHKNTTKHNKDNDNDDVDADDDKIGGGRNETQQQQPRQRKTPKKHHTKKHHHHHNKKHSHKQQQQQQQQEAGIVDDDEVAVMDDQPKHHTYVNSQHINKANNNNNNNNNKEWYDQSDDDDGDNDGSSDDASDSGDSGDSDSN